METQAYEIMTLQESLHIEITNLLFQFIHSHVSLSCTRSDSWQLSHKLQYTVLHNEWLINNMYIKGIYGWIAFVLKCYPVMDLVFRIVTHKWIKYQKSPLVKPPPPKNTKKQQHMTVISNKDFIKVTANWV